MADEQLDLFREIIIEHSQFPRHHGRLDQATHEGTVENPLCGDRITLQLIVNGEDVIEDIAYTATGCAMSLASVSLLASQLKGRSVDEASGIFTAVRSMFSSEAGDADLSDLGDLAALGVARRFPARVKCVTMPWHHLKSLLSSETGSFNSII